MDFSHPKRKSKARPLLSWPHCKLKILGHADTPSQAAETGISPTNNPKFNDIFQQQCRGSFTRFGLSPIYRSMYGNSGILVVWNTRANGYPSLHGMSKMEKRTKETKSWVNSVLLGNPGRREDGWVVYWQTSGQLS